MMVMGMAGGDVETTMMMVTSMTAAVLLMHDISIFLLSLNYAGMDNRQDWKVQDRTRIVG